MEDDRWELDAASPGGAEGLVEQIEQAARQLSMDSVRVLVAVSGGCDSMALLRGMLAIRSTLNLELIVAHLNHGWRGDESCADARWVEALAESYGLKCVVESASQSERGSGDAGSEEAAREIRYEFLIRAATRHDCRFLAVGHTADDQAETVLHHILRGTGLSGLRGMMATRPVGDGITLVRPLLEIPRAELENWLRSIDQDWRTDRTNADSNFTRNRIRNELLPLIEKQFNPQARRVLATLAQQASEVSGFVRELAETALRKIVLNSTPDSIRLDANALRQLPPVVLREALVLAWQQQNWPQQGMSFSHWESLASVALCGGTVSLPGKVDGRLRGTLLVLTRS